MWIRLGTGCTWNFHLEENCVIRFAFCSLSLSLSLSPSLLFVQRICTEAGLCCCDRFPFCLQSQRPHCSFALLDTNSCSLKLYSVIKMEGDAVKLENNYCIEINILNMKSVLLRAFNFRAVRYNVQHFTTGTATNIKKLNCHFSCSVCLVSVL
jgi:hypothetical protein